MSLGFTGERIVPGALDCEPNFAQKMYQEHIARYAFAAQLANGADVLDVGCGVGYGSQWLGKAGAKSVLGFDLSKDAINHARMNYFHPAVSFRVQNAIEIEAGDGYDLITCFELIEHIEEQEKVLDLIKVALRPAGVLAISTPRPLDHIRTHFHAHEMSFEELFAFLKARFRHVQSYFELNCFTSFIGGERPHVIDQLIPVTDRITMDHADYFIFLASDEPIDGRSQIKPLLTVNDDAYVLTLEKDVGVLRRAENDHLARIADLEDEKRALDSARGEAEAARSEAVARADMLSAIHHETGIVRTLVEQVREQQSRQSDTVSEVESLRQMLADAQQRIASHETEKFQALTEKEHFQREAARSEGEHAQVVAELDMVRRAMFQQGAQLADAQTEALVLRGNAERLPDVLSRASSLESEVNVLRYRLEYAESTLARFRGSLSWSMTKPVRWIGRTFKITRRSPPQ